MSTGCGYTHGTDGERFDDLEGSTWTCTRPTAAGADRCPFHAPAGAVGEGTVRAALLDALEEGGPVRLLGARLGSLSLDYADLEGTSNHPIDLREAAIDGPVSIRYATVDRPLRLEGAEFAGPVDLEDTTFTRRVDFGGATFAGRVSVRMATFESWLDLRETTFREPAYMRVARFHRGIYGVEATFQAAADFLNTRFDDVANFYRAQFRAGAVFDSTTFEGNAQFIEASFGAPTVKLDSASGSPRSDAETLEGVALSMAGVTCRRDFRLTGATVGGDVRFTDSDLGRALRTRGLTAPDGAVVDCTGSGPLSGEIGSDGGRIRYDATEAVVGEIDADGDAPVECFRFDATTFDGFDFSAYKRSLAARDWRLHDADRADRADPTPERLENLYLRAKNGAKGIGETRAAAEFFVKELQYRRAGHRGRVRRADTVGDALRAGRDWLANATLQATCGYGERPFRPLAFSTVLIAAFAAVYALFDAQVTYPTPGGYLIFSTEAFVALVLGLPSDEQTGTVLGFLLASEAFLGGFAIALFVFTLTRSISR